MYSTLNFRKNLNALRATKYLSMEEFSRELGIPKSTLERVLKEGDTSLHTAIQISNALGIPISNLLEDPISPSKLGVLYGFLAFIGWFSKPELAKQRTVADAVSVILEVLRK